MYALMMINKMCLHIRYLSHLVAMCSGIPHEGGLPMVVLTLRAKPA